MGSWCAHRDAPWPIGGACDTEDIGAVPLGANSYGVVGAVRARFNAQTPGDLVWIKQRCRLQPEQS